MDNNWESISFVKCVITLLQYLFNSKVELICIIRNTCLYLSTRFIYIFGIDKTNDASMADRFILSSLFYSFLQK